ncbi:Protein KES1 [Hypsizygus marmoreus]|uniref:Protein KES1 n=1 Tax=Hypsizygus marmoreus TaxID=39966 RepID=A0A369JLK1_HYPMA|nr:Protein KES1 [Hypsizygus marmoreus]
MTSTEAVPAPNVVHGPPFSNPSPPFRRPLLSHCPSLHPLPRLPPEFPAYWCEHPDIFAAIADAKDDESRALAVLRWFIVCLLSSPHLPPHHVPCRAHSKANTHPATKAWDPKETPQPRLASTTTLLVEQVSHHPPITAYVIENKTKGLRLIGHNAQKTSFSAGSIIVKQIGHAILTVSLPNNTKVEYLITLPRLRIDGLWYGSPYIELTDTSYIVGGGTSPRSSSKAKRRRVLHGFSPVFSVGMYFFLAKFKRANRKCQGIGLAFKNSKNQQLKIIVFASPMGRLASC